MVHHSGAARSWEVTDGGGGERQVPVEAPSQRLRVSSRLAQGELNTGLCCCVTRMNVVLLLSSLSLAAPT